MIYRSMPTAADAHRAIAAAARNLSWDREDGAVFMTVDGAWLAFLDALTVDAAVRDGWTLDELNEELTAARPEAVTPGRQVKLGPAIPDARDLMTYTPAEEVRDVLKAHGYTGTIDQVLTRDVSRFPVTIPEGTRGIVEGVDADGRWAIVAFVWKTPKSGKVTAAMVQVEPAHLVNHRGAPPLPGMPLPGTATTSTTSTTTEPPAMLQTLTATPPAPAAPAPSLGAMDALLNAVVDARVGARIAALEAELASRPTGAPTVRVSISGLPEVQLEGKAHTLLLEALRWAASRRRNGMRFNIALVGDAGTGKSTLAEQVAEALGLRFHPFSCSGGVAESKLFGRMTPNLNTERDVRGQALGRAER